MGRRLPPNVLVVVTSTSKADWLGLLTLPHVTEPGGPTHPPCPPGVNATTMVDCSFKFQPPKMRSRLNLNNNGAQVTHLFPHHLLAFSPLLLPHCQVNCLRFLKFAHIGIPGGNPVGQLQLHPQEGAAMRVRERVEDWQAVGWGGGHVSGVKGGALAQGRDAPPPGTPPPVLPAHVGCSEWPCRAIGCMGDGIGTAHGSHCVDIGGCCPQPQRMDATDCCCCWRRRH
jgi:hypothetical protein